MSMNRPSSGVKPGLTHLAPLGHFQVSSLNRASYPRASTFSQPGSRRRTSQALTVRVAAQSSSATVSPTDKSVTVFERTFQLSDSLAVAVKVTEATGGVQEVSITTDSSSKLLLHWGVEGGRGYKGGWRLPGAVSRPEGTVEYKKRALQTPFSKVKSSDSSSDAVKKVELRFSGDEASEFLNFVVKDTSTDRWYDINGVNFQVPLRQGLSTTAAADKVESSTNGSSSSSSSSSSATTAENLLPLDKIPSIPQDLGGVWAYMKWEANGCPGRSKEEADLEYVVSMKELTTLLRRRVSLEELRKVASEGVTRYVSFTEEMKKGRGSSNGAAAAVATALPAREKKKETPAESSVVVVEDDDGPSIPEDLVGLKAYLMWEAAGKPDGADFSEKARAALVDEIVQGKSMQELEAQIRAPQPPPPPPQQEKKQEEQKETAAVDAAPPPPPPSSAPAAAAPPPQGSVGQSMGMRERNPLDLIHRSAAPRLAEKARQRETPLSPLLAAAQEDEGCVWHRIYAMGSKAELLVTVKQSDPQNTDSPIEVVLTSDAAADLTLHWGVKQSGRNSDWKRPSEALLPKGSTLIKDGIAAETPFTGCDEEECQVEIGGSAVPLQRTSVHLPQGHGLTGLVFVIRSQDGSRWWNDGGSNFICPIPGPDRSASAPAPTFDDEISRIIVDSESTNAWTLMHRFNKAADLIQAVVSGRFDPPDAAMARIYVWLRYSSIRQLTWQRNYNTQPRILGAAQERLTHTIADAHDRLDGPALEWARLCLTTVGRGGNAQAVRDEILNIMHRNKISEVKGTWMEEFHQKLHNNTTPDDIPICEAYINFLRSNGDLNAYIRTLSEAGISRARLESFDRPIRTDPVFFGDKKDSLIRDFGNYLNILKATHSGADLQASASAASSFVPGAAKGYLGYVLGHTNDNEVLPLMEAAVEARTEISTVISSNRELIYLDLALENVVRSAAERGAAAAGTAAAALVTPLLQNLALSLADNEEVCYCLKAWLELPHAIRQGQRPAKDDALQAMAVIDRVRRALGDVSDAVNTAIGQVSADFGHSFGCEAWAVDLFAEEVVRGGPAFAVSLVLSSVEPGMRAAAELGAWQVISPAPATQGRLVVVPSLQGIQDRVYDEPTILIARRVTGEEEVPVGVVGVLSGDAPDVLSHLSVRTRNMRVLFAACYDADALDEVAALEGVAIELSTTAAGGVAWTVLEESSDSTGGEDASGGGGNNNSVFSGMMSLVNSQKKKLKMDIPPWSKQWAVEMDGFADGVVGAKSKNLAGLRGKLPDWIGLPASVTVPFACFEEALARKENSAVKAALAAEVKEVTPANSNEQLEKCRAIAAQIQIPEEATAALCVAMKNAGIPVPPKDSPAWESALDSLRAVWVSKYNERAYISTRKVGIPFDDVRMAVLVQRVISARYAFVIHTTNPTTGDDGEIYCELVRGLGEAIVSGTVPGTALAFTARKDALDAPQVLLYPSKSEGMFVEDWSLIFRSDSNGEDLEGYAGAGLYDSVTTALTVRQVVDYSSDPIVADAEFRRKLMEKVCRVGAEIEASLGSAQDIEGVIDPELNIFVVQTRPQM